jgi:fumarate reductase flavoprotein subunit
LAVDGVIIGAGRSGIPAALGAADDGARVVLVEKQTCVGGMLHVSTGQFSGAGTRLRRQCGIADDVDWLKNLGFAFLDDSPRLNHGHEVYGASLDVADKGGLAFVAGFFRECGARSST